MLTNIENGRSSVLQDEAAFSDAQYASRGDRLDIKPYMFAMYTNPEGFVWPQARMARLLGNVDGKSLLDLGCGLGEEAVYFAKLGALVTAIDISEVGISVTRRRAAYNGVSVDARVMACPTTFPASSFDIVHGIGIIHHIGLNTTLHEVNRLLRPGG